MKPFYGIALSLWSAMVLASHAPPTAHHYFSKKSHDHAAAWGYAGAIGPNHWAQLDPSYAVGCSGKQQSPINIELKAAESAKLPKLRFAYKPEKIAALNNGHTIQHQGVPDSFLFFGDEQFSLEQFHLHGPSEHTLDGKSFPLEIHFVHKSKAGEVLVVGVLVRRNDKAKLKLNLFNDLPKVTGEKVDVDITRNPADFLPQSKDYVSYPGSFTTPPCTEKVRWVVLKQPFEAPSPIIEKFTAILQGNKRPVQDLHGRTVQKSF